MHENKIIDTIFKHCFNLGFNNPYYFIKDGKFEIQDNFSKILDTYGGERKIDPVAIIEVLNKNYMLADRTIIDGIQYTPWIAKPNIGLDQWIYGSARHSLTDISEQKIADILFQKICTEIELYIGEKKKVGILLSGGMDSRIMSGSLDFLIKTDRLHGLDVTGLTWGNEGTRDVVYAKEIAHRLGWNWKHYTVTSKNLLDNITETATHGCEYSPIHLHGIPQIRNDNKNIEVILAASYGDSIGRAEYSGKKVQNLKPLLKNISNIGTIVHETIYENSKKLIVQDIERYHNQFVEAQTYMQNELDYQLHYMRRMLNPCMKLLTEQMEFYQIFTHPDVYGFMWSIKPERRTDNVYMFLLKKFKTKLSDIPWARTGLPYGQNDGRPDNFLKNHHSYAEFIQNEIIDEIEDRVLSHEIQSIGIFNEKSIQTILKLIKYVPLNNLFYLEKLIWLASLAETIKLYNIASPEYINNKKYLIQNHNFSVVTEYILRKTKNIIKSFFKY